MKIGPKYKICRRLGPGIFEKCQTRKFSLSESPAKKEGGRRGGAARTDYGIQQREKQKIRFTYGITERQFATLVRQAVAKRGANSARELYVNLENRLDNVMYRMGFATTRRHARQLVAHGHVTVNGKRIMVPSHHVRTQDEVGIRDASKKKTPFQDLPERIKEQQLPSWIVLDMQKKSAVIVGVPSQGTGGDTLQNLGAIIEFYSR